MTGAALKPHGILYASFKFSGIEGDRKGRYFIDMDVEKLECLLKETDAFAQESVCTTLDLRPGRGEERWMNTILKKKN